MILKQLSVIAAILIASLGISIFFLVVVQISAPSTPPPVSSLLAAEISKSPPPLVRTDAPRVASVSAQSYIIYDVASGQTISEKNSDKRFMPASTTKIMTAQIAMNEYDPEEILTVSRASEAIGHTVDFEIGEQFRVSDMIKAMMINSGNDAAVSLADHHPRGYQAFVSLMNQKAISLGLKNTHFSNVSGVEADDHYSSAHDLVTISVEAMKSPVFRDIVGTKTATITTIDGKRIHPLENLNQLLWDVPGVIGIKTGWTEMAGDCLVTYVSRDYHDLIVVVLNSKNRFADSTTLINWAYKNIIWQ